MGAIACLLKHMIEEVEDAETYANLALGVKEKDSGLADTYLTLAQEELGHFSRLSSQLDRYVSSVPANSEELFSFAREKAFDGFIRAKVLVESIR